VKSRFLFLVSAPVFSFFWTTALGQTSVSPRDPSAHPELVLQVGHAKLINTLEFSPDGKWLVSASEDLTIKIWDLATGSVVRTIQTGKHTTTLAISPDATVLAAGSGSGKALPYADDPGKYTIDLWDVETGRKLKTLGSHLFSIQGLAFNQDGSELTSVSGDAIKRWDVSTGSAKASYEIELGPHRENGAMAQSVLSPDGRFVAGAAYGKPFKIYETATGKEITDTKIKVELQTTVAFSADGRLVTFLLKDKAVIRESSGGPDLHVFATGVSVLPARGNLIFSPDSRSLVTLRPGAGAIDRGAAKVWDVAKGTLVREIGTAVSNVSPVARFSADGRLIAENSGTGIRVLNSVSGRDELLLSAEEEVPIEETDAYKAYMSDPKSLEYLKKYAGVSTPEEIKAYFESHKEQIAAASAALSRDYLPDAYKAKNEFTFSPDGRWLVDRHKLMKSTRTQLWNTSAGVPARNADAGVSLDAIGQPGLSPDGRFRAAPPDTHPFGAGLKREFTPFSRRPNPHKDPFMYAKDIALFDAKSNAKLHVFSVGKTDDPYFISVYGFSLDGELIAISGLDDAHQRAIFVFETVSGRKASEIRGREHIENIAVSSKARILAVGNGKQVELLDSATGRSLHILTTDDGAKSLTFSPSGRILGIAGNSGNEELWDVASGNKLVTLVNLVGALGGESKEWLVVTPDGLFDGSPAAWAHILWRFSGRTFDVTPVELFFNEYYYPGLLADILHGQRPRASQDISTKDRRQPHLTVTAGDGMSSASSVSTRAIKVVLGVANAPAGARDLRLFRNGSLVKVWHGDVLKGAEHVSLEATVSIVAGENKFTAYGFNQDNIKSQDAVLTIEGTESLKRPAVLYVVTVGINAYANAEFNLKYAAADAQVFAEEVKRQQIKLGRFSRVEVAHLSDQDATKANILLALKALSSGGAGASSASLPAALRNLAPAQPEDGVILFYAGHGTAQESRFYLIPHDLGYSGERVNLNEQSAQTILQHSISDQEIEEALEEVDAGQALLVIDACNSGQALEAEEKRRGPMNSKGLAQLAYEKGMNILTASQSYQAALEASQLGHGYLTYALVEEGLKTDAADIAPKDGQVEVREWLDYATNRVPQMQEIKIQETRAQGRELAFVARAERGEDAEKQEVQRPRAFYRRELQQQPFIIARPQQ
jgi:WD40 repeat protein/uncharacterized caspase-like protein